MDKSERAKLRQLANDSIIATFGTECAEERLAKALEKCVDELSDLADDCEVCKLCSVHGDWEGLEPEKVDCGDVLAIHKQLMERVKELQAIHVELAATGAESDDEVGLLTEKLAQRIEDLESDCDDLEALVIP